MQTALVTLETSPSQAYFDTLIAADLPNRERIFAAMVTRAAALEDMTTTYSIFIWEGNRAAYQKVVTGLFTQPYVFGNTNVPPTNAPVRLVWQGMMDVNGEGKISADYVVTDGFATFQEWGSIPLAPGQEHGQLGIAPFDEGDAAPFREGLREVDRNNDIMREMARLLTIDANGNDATAPEFDAGLIVQYGYALDYSKLPETSLNAAVHQDEWSAGYYTVATQPDTEISPTFYEVDAVLSAPEPLEIPHFAFIHKNALGIIDQVYINYDLLGITNALMVNPTTFLLPPLPPLTEEELQMTAQAEEEALRIAELTMTAAGTPAPTAVATPTTAPSS